MHHGRPERLEVRQEQRQAEEGRAGRLEQEAQEAQRVAGEERVAEQSPSA